MFQSACVPYSAKARLYKQAKSSGPGGALFMAPRFYHESALRGKQQKCHG